jgi:hypothetical protein
MSYLHEKLQEKFSLVFISSKFDEGVYKATCLEFSVRDDRDRVSIETQDLKFKILLDIGLPAVSFWVNGHQVPFKREGLIALGKRYPKFVEVVTYCLDLK